MLDLDPGPLSRLLKRLESAELVGRNRDPQDGRSLAVVLTERGRALREDALSVPRTIVDRLGMDVEQLLALHARLTDVIAVAKAAANS